MSENFSSTVGGLDLWFTHMLTVGGRDLWFTHALNFVVKWTLEGTNATHNLPYRLHKSATPSPKATYTPNFQTHFVMLVYVFDVQNREANIGLTLHTDFVDPVVSACVSTVGIYAVCNALSPEEPRHYNQHISENYRST